MRKTFKKYFIPHEENDHKPHFLRRETTARTLSVILVFELLFFVYAFVVVPNSSYLAAIFGTVLTDLTNENRESNDIPTLKVNPILEQAAARKAEDMAKVGYFSHNGPDGKTPWQWLKESGYVYRYAGENLAVNFIDSGDVLTAWMNSPGHRKNILDNRFTEIGIGTANGIYEGRETIFVVQFFGKPIIESSPAPVAVQPRVSSPKPAPAVVKPEETKPAPVKQEKPKEEIKLVGGGAPVTTKPAEALSPSIPPVLAKISTSPSALLNRLFMGLLGLVLVSLALTTGLRFNVKHPSLLLNGTLVIVILLGFLILNRYIALANIGI